jgi:hypothetical protein
MTYLMNIRCTNSTFVLLTKDEGLRAANIERLKLAERELPYYLRQRNKGDSNNTEGLTVRSLNNHYKGLLPNKSKKMALNVGRGLTAATYQVDEGAFLHNIGITLPALLAAGTAARNAARANDMPYGTIITTTAGKKDDPDGKYMYEQFSKSATWTEMFMDAANVEELEKLVMKNSSAGWLSVDCTFNHRQLGYTDEWLKAAIRDAKATGQDAERDFLCRWTSGSLSSPIPPEFTDGIRGGQMEPKYIQVWKGYVIRWYIEENEIASRMDYPNIMATDTSDASGGDDISLVIVDSRTGEVLAAGTYNETNLIQFSDYLYGWMVTYPKLILIPERRSTGSTIIDYLMLYMYNDGINPYARIFNRVVNEYEEDRDRFREVNYKRVSNDVIVKYKKLVGFTTSASGVTSRSDLYSETMQSAIRVTGTKLKDRKLIDQLLSLEIRNNRVDHPQGEHDDLLIAYLLAYFFLTKAKNHSFYGLNPNEALSRTKPIETYTENDYLARSYKDQINERYNLLLDERDKFIQTKLERELELLTNKLNQVSNQEVLTYESLRQRLEDDRRTRLRYS